MSPNWYAAPVLVRERASVNKKWPKRSKKSDGWIGNTAHQGTESDHNRDPKSKPPGVVRASDTTNEGIRRAVLVAAQILHPATKYVISNRRIMSRTGGRKFRPAAYNGRNPHTEHVHRSIMRGAEGLLNSLTFIDFVPVWTKVQQGDTGARAREVQAMLIAYGYSLALDGKFGPATTDALKRWQRARNLKADGIAGPATRRAFLGQ